MTSLLTPKARPRSQLVLAPIAGAGRMRRYQGFAEKKIAGHQRSGGDCVAEDFDALFLWRPQDALLNIANAIAAEKDMHDLVQQSERAPIVLELTVDADDRQRALA
jgi:hypothetical protein